MSGGYDLKPGGASLVDAPHGGADTAAAGKRTLTEQLDAGARSYTVKPGDTLPAIAEKLHVSVAALKAANAAKLKSYPTRSGGAVQGFRAGEALEIPREPGASAPAAAPSPPSASAPAPAPAAPGGAGGSMGGNMIDALFGKIGGALHDAWDFVTGRDDAPPVAIDPAEVAEPPAPKPASSEAGPAAPAKVAPAAPTAAPAKATPDAPPAPAEAGPAVAAPMAELSDAARGDRLSTFRPDELGTIDKFGMSKTGRDAAKGREQWLTAAEVRKAGAHKSGEAFVDAIDAMVDQKKFTEDQDQIIEAAREFASAPKGLTPAQEQHAVIDWSKAQLSLDGVSLNDDLKARLVRYVRFLAWAGLVSGPSTAGSVMRSPPAAHKLSVAWMFNVTANTVGGSTLHKADNRQKLVASVAASGGTDKDGNTWLSDTTVEGLKSKKDDDGALFAYIKSTAAPEAQKIQTQSAIAAEGYTTADKRHPNVLGGTSVSNHLLGEAVDLFPPFVLSNKFDPIIDAIAAYFGLWRAVKDAAGSPEHWHYERLGTPPGAETTDAH